MENIKWECPICSTSNYSYVPYSYEDEYTCIELTWYFCKHCTVMFLNPDKFNKKNI